MPTHKPSRHWLNPKLASLLAFSLLLANTSPLSAQTTAPAAVATPAAANVSAATALSERERELVAGVKVETLREVTAALSAPEMQGRGTMQPGGERAAQYIADRYAKLGLKPLGDKNTFLQNIKFRDTLANHEATLKVGDTTLAVGRDYIVTPPYSGDENISGKMAFIAYGLTAKAPKREDLKDMNLAGKIVVLLEGPPKGVSKEDWRKAKVGQMIMRGLYGSGATAIITVAAKDEDHPYTEAADYLVRRQVELADEFEMPTEAPPFITVSDEGAEKLFAGSGMTFAQAREKAEAGEYASLNLKQSAKITVRLKKTKGTSSNVVGYLEGSDPKLKAEAIVFTAHYDAYGMDAQGRIFPGAADNALGVAEMIAVAESLSKSATRPRRSVIFLAVTGEEYGLYGAEYWTKNPTWKIDRVAANFNYDGIGTEVYGAVKKIVGFGAEHSDLGAVLTGVTAATDTMIVPDPMPEEKVFYRSDHYAFVKRGIPALMLMGAPDIETKDLIARIKKFEKTDYHQPTDIIRPDWDWNGARTIAVVGLLSALRVAEADEMPKWLTSSRFNRKRGTNDPPPEEN